jgi:hypothetical protein
MRVVLIKDLKKLKLGGLGAEDVGIRWFLR